MIGRGGFGKEISFDSIVQVGLALVTFLSKGRTKK